ncbi:MAG: tetratricopeptide repeat protein [Gaiellaceae bacterium]
MATAQAPTAAAFAPYLPRLALEWEARFGAARAQAVDGSLVGIDLSGFTALSEQLAVRGRLGAEELITTISRIYSNLIALALAHGGDVLKFRGDALLLFFDGAGHEVRAVAAAAEMQQFIAVHGEQPSSVGPVRLGMACGVVSGPCHFFLLGSRHQELIVCGPAASATLALEDEGERGETLVSARTAEALQPGFVGEPRGDGFLLTATPVGAKADAPVAAVPADVELYIPPGLRERLSTGAVESEHRHATAAFVRFRGTDALVGDLDTAEAALGALADVVSETTDELDVTWLESDIDRDGGKLYLVAGAPWSAGGDEERVLRAARAIVDAGVGPPIAIGIHRGPVFAGVIGSAERRTYAVMGDTVNVAARLAARAEQGEILATGDVLQRSRTRFDTTSRQLLAKGKEQPITAFSVGSLVEVVSETERERLPLVDREHELPQLVEAINAARLRESRAVELVGEAGIGKSRLVEELKTLAVGFQQLEARCEQYAAATPFAPLSAMLRPLVGILPDTAPEEAGRLLQAFVASVMPDLAPWLPLLALPFDAEVEPTAEVDEIDPAFRRDRLHEVIEQLLSRLLLMPTSILIEDAHWLDDASQLLIRKLAQPAPRPWFLCITRRPGGPAVAGDSAAVLELAPLPEGDARTLALAAAGDEALSEEQLEELAERSGGNPLFLRELVAAPQLEAGLPESLETLLTTRIDTLSPEDRLLLRHAAVIGRSFELDLLAEIQTEEKGADPNRWLRLAEFVEWQDGSTLRFSHDLVRTAAYEGLPFAVRREIHGRVGAALERRVAEAEDLAALLSLHFFEAGEFDKAWSYSVAAGDDARSKYANVDAAIFYERALGAAAELSSDPVAASQVAEALGDVYELTARYEEADGAYAQAEVCAADVTARARLLRKRGILSERTGRYDDALESYARGLELGDADEAELAELANATAIVLYRQGKLEECVVWTEQAIARAKSAHDRKGLARAYYIRGAAEGDLGGPAREFLELALPIFEELGDLVSVGVVLNNMGIPAHYEGKWDEAIARYRAGREASNRAGDVVRAATATGNEAEVLLDQGRLDEAAELFADALRVQRAAGFAFGVGSATTNLGVIAARRGSFDEAHRLLAEARAQFEEIGAGSFALHVRVREAEALVLEGRHGHAIAQAGEASAALAEAGEVGVHTAQLERLIGYALVQARRPDDAGPHLAESLRVARELGAAHEEALTLKALADTGLGSPGDGEAARRILDGLGVVSVPAIPLP